jgi:SAM-dependent methyltransferase
VADDPKHIVASGYDTCGRRYSAARAQDPSPEIEQLLGTLSPHATVLDIGCGAGVPVVSALSRSCKVVGVDISSVQIEQARLNVPQATFMLGDIMAMEFAPRTFDAVVSFYTLFHLPREEHGLLLERIALWLRPGGHLLFTVANSSHPGYTEPDFFGATMYWSHFERSWYSSALRELGFEVLAEGVLGHGYRDVPGLPPERHPVVFARLERSKRTAA